MNLSKLFTKRNIIDVLLIVAGSTVTALATQYIFDPAGLVTGGVSGLSIIIKHLSKAAGGMEIPLWLTTLVLNIPIFLFAIKTNGFKRILRTALSWIIITVELYFFPQWNPNIDNLLLVSLYGGLLFGLGTGLLLLARATSGGTDLLGSTLHKYLRHISQGKLIEFMDGLVVLAGVFVFSIENTLFAIISVFVMGRVIDYVVGRGKSARIAFIISDQSDEIAAQIMKDLDRGVTGLTGRGMYSGAEKTVLMCICNNRDLVEIKDLVKALDPGAFFVIGSVNEAMGEGFIEHWG